MIPANAGTEANMSVFFRMALKRKIRIHPNVSIRRIVREVSSRYQQIIKLSNKVFILFLLRETRRIYTDNQVCFFQKKTPPGRGGGDTGGSPPTSRPPIPPKNVKRELPATRAIYNIPELLSSVFSE